MLSGKQKVELLGFDGDVFWDDVSALDEYINFDYTEENLKNKVYPYLKRLKARYGFDIPINYMGLDVVRLDNRLDRALEEKRKWNKKN